MCSWKGVGFPIGPDAFFHLKLSELELSDGSTGPWQGQLSAKGSF